jgi:ABC-type cobalamin/Fe3+-siderophores transport system ATPase subunit
VAGVAVRPVRAPVLAKSISEVAAGEVVGLPGRNGAGKTTLLRVACGALAPDAGQVRLEGRALDSIDRRERARIAALVPQDTQLAFPFSVAEVVLMGRTPHLGWLAWASRTRRSLRADTVGGERQLATGRALARAAPAAARRAHRVPRPAIGSKC